MEESPKKKSLYFKRLKSLSSMVDEEGLVINGELLEDALLEKLAGSNTEFKSLVTKLYESEITLKEFILSILDLMAYSPAYMLKENVEFIKVVRQTIGTSKWYESEDNYTDYRLDNKETRLESIADIPAAIVREIDHRLSLVKEPIFKAVKPWELDVIDYRYAKILHDPAVYEAPQIANFVLIEKTLHEALQSDDITPGQALDVIIQYWPILWNFTSVYEAVEYCVVLSKSINDNPTIRKQFRLCLKKLSSYQDGIHLQMEKALSSPASSLSSRLWMWLNGTNIR